MGKVWSRKTFQNLKYSLTIVNENTKLLIFSNLKGGESHFQSSRKAFEVRAKIHAIISSCLQVMPKLFFSSFTRQTYRKLEKFLAFANQFSTFQNLYLLIFKKKKKKSVSSYWQGSFANLLFWSHHYLSGVDIRHPHSDFPGKRKEAKPYYR